MKFTLNNTYGRDFLVTQSGNTYKKDVVTEVEIMGWEDERYREQGFILPVGKVDEEELKKIQNEKLYQQKQEIEVRAQTEKIRKANQEEQYKKDLVDKMAKEEQAKEAAKPDTKQVEEAKTDAKPVVDSKPEIFK